MGFAHTLFREREGKSLRGSLNPSLTKARWVSLERMVEQKKLSFVDYALAETLLSPYPFASEEIAAVICYLSMASRSGHLCVHFSDSGLLPDPQQLFMDSMAEEDAERAPISMDEIAQFERMLRAGIDQIPSSLIREVQKDDEQPLTPLCRSGQTIYFQRHWRDESLFLQHYQRLLKADPYPHLDDKKLMESLQKRAESGSLLPEQIEAIRASLGKSVAIICGGPGTGKTYTAGVCIQVLWEALEPEKRSHYEIVLAAPTGKAAANLQASLNRVMSSLEGSRPLVAKTLHSLLGFSSDKRSAEASSLSADCILVDESSMIDVRMMAQLCASVKEGARLILLGDDHQLPPVETGSLFADIVHQSKTFYHNAVELKVCLRTESRAIIDFAQAIDDGDGEQALGLLEDPAFSRSLRRFQTSDAQEEIPLVQQALVEHTLKAFPSVKEEDLSSPEAIHLLRAFCLLSPLRRGPFGVETLNCLLAKKAVEQQHQGAFIAPILITRNHSRLELFNGDMGFLIRRSFVKGKRGQHLMEHQPQEGDEAFFPRRDPQTGAESMQRIPALLLPSYEYAYALSVHKSQGSEFNRVLLLLPPGSERFGRSVLYTAATRARKELEVWGTDAILRTIIQRQTRRISGFSK